MTTDLLKNEYESAIRNDSDINEHLEVLKELADECAHVTEMGTRTGISTRAFLNSDVILRAYDLSLDSGVNGLFEHAKNSGKDVSYVESNVLDIEIEETDLLFIDTLHTFDQLKTELFLHSPKVKKYIILHDTTSYEWEGEMVNGVSQKGLWPAVEDFLNLNSNWFILERFGNNNGLTILKRNI